MVGCAIKRNLKINMNDNNWKIAKKIANDFEYFCPACNEFHKIKFGFIRTFLIRFMIWRYLKMGFSPVWIKIKIKNVLEKTY